MARHKNATGYEPLNTLKPVATDIWLVDGPAVRCHGIPYPTRCTVVRLADGDLWVHSPTLLSNELRTELQALGPVRYLIAVNWRHYMNTADWQGAYPHSVTYAPPDVAALASRQATALQVDNVLGRTAPQAWAAQIDQMIVAGSRRHSEAAFLHRASSTLMLTNLIQNFETSELPALLRPLIWLAGIDDSDGKMPPAMLMTYRKTILAESIEEMIGWGPQRLILAHGRWYRQDAATELRRAFRRVLRDREWIAAMKSLEK